MEIGIGSDHRGFDLKEQLKKLLKKDGYAVKDFGTDSMKPSDYPDFALEVAESVAEGRTEMGILVCKTGIGMSIAANKVPGIRAAFCKDESAARLSREHNDANVLALEGGTEPAAAFRIAKLWLTTRFLEREPRHIKRIEKIHDIEKKYSCAPRVG